MKRILLSTALVAIVPLSLNAEIGISSNQIAGSVAVVAQGIEDGTAREAVVEELSGFVLGEINSGLNFIEERALVTMDLSRFDAAPLIAFTVTKETDYGIETDGRIPPRCGAYCADQWAYPQTGG
jgi:hypothetical protein